MIVTRFNPSTNGNLHLGHIYTLMVNEQFAHNNDGKFYVRFDDTSQAITIEMKDQLKAKDIIHSQKETIKWLGFPVDGWDIQSVILNEVHEIMNKLLPDMDWLPDPYPHTLPTFIRKIGTGWNPYPYTPFETPERVVMDHMLGITHVIRGEDFSTEYSLYRYFCDLFEYEAPKFVFLPRLMSSRGDISKTNGGYTIVELRAEGYTPEEIKDLLCRACLNYFGDDWSWHNLKPNPRIDL